MKNIETFYIYLEQILFLRMIFSIISLVACFIIILLYIILFIQVKFSKNSNKNEQENINSISSEGLNSNKSNKIGLGSHYMFFLVISNFFGAIVEGSLYIYLNQDDMQFPETEFYKKFSDTPYCKGYAFFHNFFELSGICWTTMITKLFYYSTQIVISGSQKQQMAKAFTYSFLSSLIISILPVIFGGYGFAYTHCSFVKKDFDNSNTHTLSIIFGAILTIFIILNALFYIYALFKSYSFYKKKIKQLKEQNEGEYSSLKVYVYLFFIFPIVLMITRIMKLIQYFVDFLDKEEWIYIVIILTYINSILYCLTGTFDSAFCFFFFRGVYKTCCNQNNQEIDPMDDETIISNEVKQFTPTS